MKYRFWALAFLCVASWLGTPLAAEDKVEAPGDEAAPAVLETVPQHFRERFIKRYDKDGDGKVTGDEWKVVHEDWAAHRLAFRQRLLTKFDANGNGVLDPDERLAARPSADRWEDYWDWLENVRDRREDVRDKREDVRDARCDGGPADRAEDVRDRREDARDRREDARDRRENRRDRRR